jgi:hypothetical protein
LVLKPEEILVIEYSCPDGAVDERGERYPGLAHILEALAQVLADELHVLLEMRHVQLLELLMRLFGFVLAAGVGVVAEVVVDVQIDHADARNERVDLHQRLLGGLEHRGIFIII